VIDSQSVKADAVVGADSRGFDGGKQINGRKRHVVVDTLGLARAVNRTHRASSMRAARVASPNSVSAATAELDTRSPYTPPNSAVGWASQSHTAGL